MRKNATIGSLRDGSRFYLDGDRLYLLYLKDKVVGTFTLETWW